MKTTRNACVSLLALLAGLCGSAVQAQDASPAADNTNVILILAAQGIDPARDTAKFNETVRNVTQAFANRLTPLLEQHKLKVVNVLDQEPRYSPQQKFAIYSARNGARYAVMLSLENQVNDGDEQLQLMAQHVVAEPVTRDGRVVGVTPLSVVDKRYLLVSTRQGASPGTMSELAEDFSRYLESQQRYPDSAAATQK